MNEQLLSPPESYPIPDTGLQNYDTTYIGESIEEKKEFLVVTRNSLEILSSILNSEVEPKPIKVTLLSPPFCWLCFTKLKIFSLLWSSALRFFHFFYSCYSGHLSFVTPLF